MSDLKTLTLEELRKRGDKYGIKLEGLSKKDLVSLLEKEVSQRKKNLDKYEIKQQLGLRGKDGKTFLVVDKFGYEYAMKQFRKNKAAQCVDLEFVYCSRICSGPL